MNGRAGKLTQDARPPRRVQAWDTALYNTDSSTEDKPPTYEEAVPNDGYVAVDGVYTEMEYADPPRIIVRKSWWSSKKRIIILVLFLLVLLGGITFAVIFFGLKSGGSNLLEDGAVVSTFTSTTSTSTTTSTFTSTTSTSTTTSTFTSTSTSPSVEYLIVAGGGAGGGGCQGGGGGAGGFRTNVAGSLSGTGAVPEGQMNVVIGLPYFVRVGRGGKASIISATNGEDSSFNNITSTGGGRGAGEYGGCNLQFSGGKNQPANDGGSGGGGSHGSTATVSIDYYGYGLSGQGRNGSYGLECSTAWLLFIRRGWWWRSW